MKKRRAILNLPRLWTGLQPDISEPAGSVHRHQNGAFGPVASLPVTVCFLSPRGAAGLGLEIFSPPLPERISTGNIFCFSPPLLEYRRGEANFATVTDTAESLARFGPPGSGSGTPSPGLDPGRIAAGPALVSGAEGRKGTGPGRRGQLYYCWLPWSSVPLLSCCE